jgi:predicted permease
MHPVLSSLLPVVLLIALGYGAGRAKLLGPAASKDLSNLVFVLLTPALLFRTMAGVQVQQLQFRPVAAYFLGAMLLFAAVLLLWGLNRRATVLALASTYSNLVMIGIPLVGLAYGDAGLVTLFTLISLHALVLLTLATVVLEFALAREEARAGRSPQRHIAASVALAVRNAVLHPVPLPIIAGLLFAQTGWRIPEVVDKPLQLLGIAFGPLALILVGVTLTAARIGDQWRAALGLALAKNLLMPAVVLALGWGLRLPAAPLAVMGVAAALPIGANVFLFSQRYQVAQELTTASVAVSNVLGLATLSLVMSVLKLLPA